MKSRSKTRVVLWVVGSIGIVLALSFASYKALEALAELDMDEAHYADRKEAQLGGLGQGWLPDSLPDSAHEIYESHNLDSNAVWARFDFDIEDMTDISESCMEIELKEANYPGPPGTRREWWDLNLDNSKSYRFYRNVIDFSTSRSEGFYAVDPQTGRGYYWSVY